MAVVNPVSGMIVKLYRIGVCQYTLQDHLQSWIQVTVPRPCFIQNQIEPRKPIEFLAKIWKVSVDLRPHCLNTRASIDLRLIYKAIMDDQD